MAALRVVLDTNVLLSSIAYPDSIPGKILTAWRRGSVAVLLSDYILEELRRVLPKLAQGMVVLSAPGGLQFGLPLAPATRDQSL
ncbi:MAG: PIN domain-containing protein [Gammaproteobacteria bacterium]|nr:PIN domain-containing protein [Gammaproteobacteria bacterium]